MSKPYIYLDHAAATPLDPRVQAAMQPYLAEQFYNPSATYAAARQIRQALDEARAKVAYWLGARPSEIIFTAGGTEANNLAVHGVMQRFPKANIVVSAIDHDSVLVPAQSYDYRKVRAQPDGRLDMADLAKKIDDNTVLVGIGYTNNEIGTVQPIREISRLIAQARQKRSSKSKLPLYFHTDACQAGNFLDLHVARLGVDMMTLNGGKIYGPKQSGALYLKAGMELEPLISGGGQERGLRSGTENVAASIGFAIALDLVQASRRSESARLQKLQQQFMAGLEEISTLNGSLKYRLPNNIHATFPGQDNERLLIQLEEQGILAAAGSACSASTQEPSHVLKAIGLNDADARASLRFTLGRENTAKDVDKAIETLNKIL